MNAEEAKKCLKLISEKFRLELSCWRRVENVDGDEEWFGFDEPKFNEPICTYGLHFDQKDWPIELDRITVTSNSTFETMSDIGIAVAPGVAATFNEACLHFVKYLSGRELFGDDFEKCKRLGQRLYRMNRSSYRKSLCRIPEFDSYEELKLKLSVVE